MTPLTVNHLEARSENVQRASEVGKAGGRKYRGWAGWAAAMLLVGLWACDGANLPADYRRMEIPESRLNSPQARVRGRRLFLKHCALCHGERGDGQGRRGYLSVRPADFTDPAWRDGMTARRAYYIEREGIRGTPMPAWKALSEEETWDLVAYVLSVAEMGPRVEVE